MERRLSRVYTNDEAEWFYLRLANEKGKFALSLGPIPHEQVQEAFERGIDQGWFTLVDLTPLSSIRSNEVMRVFRLTEAGWQRRHQLQEKLEPTQ